VANDPHFNGILERERLVDEYKSNGSVINASSAPNVLPIQSCPPQRYKVCDVHVGVRSDIHGQLTLDWLDSLQIASFNKTRLDGVWRIHTATFDDADAGRFFFEAIIRYAPRRRDTLMRVKLERIEAALRHPADAVTLPLTYSGQLSDWLSKMDADATV
jgi:hypothetical protein